MTRAEEAAMKAYPVQIVSGPIGLEEQKFDFYGFTRAIFIEGYEQAEKDNGWISVDKSLPPVGEEVIVLTNEMNGHNLPDASHLCFAHRPDPEVAVCHDGWNIPGVKYWLYCPELPIESNRPLSSDNSLEDEMINYWGRIPDDKDLIDTARHFALWQKEKMMDEWLKDRDGCFWDGVNEGKKAMKEQMMKDAVETELYWDGDFLAIDLNMTALGYSERDKVRVIIVKEE